MSFNVYQATVTHGQESETVTETRKDNLVYSITDVILGLVDTGDVTVAFRKFDAEEVSNAQQQP